MSVRCLPALACVSIEKDGVRRKIREDAVITDRERPCGDGGLLATGRPEGSPVAHFRWQRHV